MTSFTVKLTDTLVASWFNCGKSFYMQFNCNFSPVYDSVKVAYIWMSKGIFTFETFNVCDIVIQET